jgi:hypothetical protein
MFLAAYDYNREFIKYALVIVSAPFWWPFVKAAWEELNDSLRDEGGLFGDEPDAQELAELNLEKGTYESPMVSEPWELPARKGWGATRMSSTGRGMLAQNREPPGLRRRANRRSGFEKR